MTATLPADICLSFVNATWREKRNRHVDEDITESGKPITSKKPGSPETTIAGTVKVDRGGKTSWDAFYRTACSEGSIPFYAPDPDTKLLQVFRWVDTISWSKAGNKFFGEISLARE